MNVDCNMNRRSALGRGALSRARDALDVVAVVMMIIASVAIVWVTVGGRTGHANIARGRDSVQLPNEPVSIGWSEAKGSRLSRVGIIEFTDFQCPSCRAFARDTLPALEDRFINAGMVLLVVRHLPLENVHRWARQAAEVAECAGRNRQFWKMHDELFRVTGGLDRVGISRAASLVGLSPAQIAACGQDGTISEQVQSDIQLARQLGIAGTPSFLIGVLDRGKVRVMKTLSGAAPRPTFETILNELLNSTKSMRRSVATPTASR